MFADAAKGGEFNFPLIPAAQYKIHFQPVGRQHLGNGVRPFGQNNGAFVFQHFFKTQIKNFALAQAEQIYMKQFNVFVFVFFHQAETGADRGAFKPQRRRHAFYKHRFARANRPAQKNNFPPF